MVDWSIILCTNNHKTGNGTGTGRRTVTIPLNRFFDHCNLGQMQSRQPDIQDSRAILANTDTLSSFSFAVIYHLLS